MKNIIELSYRYLKLNPYVSIKNSIPDKKPSTKTVIENWKEKNDIELYPTNKIDFEQFWIDFNNFIKNLEKTDFNEKIQSAIQNEDNISLIIYSVKMFIDSKQNSSQFVGKIGDKLETTCKYCKSVLIDGYYGQSTFHIFHTSENDTVTCFSNSSTWKNIKPGNTFIVRGKIKKHNDDPIYGKSTELNYAKMIQITQEK